MDLDTRPEEATGGSDSCSLGLALLKLSSLGFAFFKLSSLGLAFLALSSLGLPFLKLLLLLSLRTLAWSPLSSWSLS